MAIMTTSAQVVRDRNRRIQETVPGIRKPMQAIPDEELIANLVRYGQPRWAAEEVKTNPQVRFAATQFFCDCLDANEGDKRARMQVDFIREQWVALRKEELLADDLGRTHGDIIDARTLL
jgi:hypothetical protein